MEYSEDYLDLTGSRKEPQPLSKTDEEDPDEEDPDEEDPSLLAIKRLHKAAAVPNSYHYPSH